MIIRWSHKSKRGRRSNVVNKAKSDFFKRHYCATTAGICPYNINLTKRSKYKKFKHYVPYN